MSLNIKLFFFAFTLWTIWLNMLPLSLFISLVPNPLICSVEVIAKNATSANFSSMNYLKQIPPMTLSLSLRIIIDSWFLSKTNFTMYYLGILGSCLENMFFRSRRHFNDYLFPSFRITLKDISFFYYCIFAALSRAVNPNPIFYIIFNLTYPCIPTKLFVFSLFPSIYIST